MNEQVAYSFDKVSVMKILKGLAIAVTGAIGLAILNYVGALQFSNPMVAYAVATFVPTLVNVVKEWIKGKSVS
jgi:hypothetical protein